MVDMGPSGLLVVHARAEERVSLVDENDTRVVLPGGGEDLLDLLLGFTDVAPIDICVAQSHHDGMRVLCKRPDEMRFSGSWWSV